MLLFSGPHVFTVCIGCFLDLYSVTFSVESVIFIFTVLVITSLIDNVCCVGCTHSSRHFSETCREEDE